MGTIAQPICTRGCASCRVATCTWKYLSYGFKKVGLIHQKSSANEKVKDWVDVKVCFLCQIWVPTLAYGSY
jgi:hypothetical protein